MRTTALILPGFGDSDPGHWQSLWEMENPGFKRVMQRDWNNPICSEWIVSLEDSLAQLDEHVVLIAHSLGCLLIALWAIQTNRKIKGALLVAPPDSARDDFPEEIVGFSSIPLKPFKFPSIVVASSNDPYGDLEFTTSCATAWGSRFVNIGAAGHINTSSGLEEWKEGFVLYQQLARYRS